jgi:hypothetical protein
LAHINKYYYVSVFRKYYVVTNLLGRKVVEVFFPYGPIISPSGLYAQAPASQARAAAGPGATQSGARTRRRRRQTETFCLRRPAGKQASSCGLRAGRWSRRVKARNRGTRRFGEKGVEGEAGPPARSSPFGLPQRLEESVRGRAAGAVVRRRRERERGT